MNKQNYNLQINTKDIIGRLLEKREEEIYNVKENEDDLIKKQSKTYSDIYVAINNVPNAFVETKKGIETRIEKYLETLNEVQGIENEKFYREGFSDAINLIISCISKNSDKERNSKF